MGAKNKWGESRLNFRMSNWRGELPIHLMIFVHSSRFHLGTTLRKTRSASKGEMHC